MKFFDQSVGTIQKFVLIDKEHIQKSLTILCCQMCACNHRNQGVQPALEPTKVCVSICNAHNGIQTNQHAEEARCVPGILGRSCSMGCKAFPSLLHLSKGLFLAVYFTSL